MIKLILTAILNKFSRFFFILRSIRDTLDQNQPIFQTPWNFLLQGNKEMALGNFEKNETNTVRELLLEVDMMVNVGANIGYYCCHALSLGKSVIAIEPLPRNLNYLLNNICLNHWTNNVQIFPVALGNATDILNMWGTDTGASLVRGWANIPNSYVRKVPVLTLDIVLGKSLYNKKALILVDIEGSEFAMLQGAVDALNNHIRPIWMIEITLHQNQPSGIKVNPNFLRTFELFFSKGYRAFFANQVNGLEIFLKDAIDIFNNKKNITEYNFIFR